MTQELSGKQERSDPVLADLAGMIHIAHIKVLKEQILGRSLEHDISEELLLISDNGMNFRGTFVYGTGIYDGDLVKKSENVGEVEFFSRLHDHITQRGVNRAEGIHAYEYKRVFTERGGRTAVNYFRILGVVE